MVRNSQPEDGSLDEHQDEQSHQTYVTVEDLHPPRSPSEAYRDRLLRFLDRPFFQSIGLVVLVLIIADGAFFFFLLVGWQAMCRPRTDCDPRNWWYNWSIQFLNILFSYQAVITMPWRSTNFLHLTGCSCPRRSNKPGLNLYGVSDSNLWFHIPVRPRLVITSLLLGNSIFQFINQGTRFYFYSHVRQASFPGNIWTNVFFAASFVCAGVAVVWQLHEAGRVRAQHPRGTFGPGPMDTLREVWRKYCPQKISIRTKKKNQPTSEVEVVTESIRADSFVEETEDDVVDDDAVEQPSNPSPALQVQQQQHDNYRDVPFSVDPTRDPQLRHILPVDDRAGLRLWGI